MSLPGDAASDVNPSRYACVTCFLFATVVADAVTVPVSDHLLPAPIVPVLVVKGIYGESLAAYAQPSRVRQAVLKTLVKEEYQCDSIWNQGLCLARRAFGHVRKTGDFLDVRWVEPTGVIGNEAYHPSIQFFAEFAQRLTDHGTP